MKELSCFHPNCQARVYLTDGQYRYHKERGSAFFCTAGHEQVFRPSENDNLRAKIGRLEDEIKRLERRADYAETRQLQERHNWKCPFGGCYHETGSKGSMVRHIKTKHKTDVAPLLLSADAGPDALNTVVH
jgi:hypothetical protein